MNRRTTIVTALALLSACARGPVRPATVHLDPGAGTFTVMDSASGGEMVCSTECSATYPTRTRLAVRLSWPHSDGVDHASAAVSVGRDLSLRGEWHDRSGLRVLGGLVLFLGGGLGAGVAGLGGVLSERARRDPDELRSGFGAVGSALVIFLGVGVGAAAIGVGTALLGLRDHASIHVGPLRDPTVTLTPTDGGAMLSLGAGF